MAWGERQIKGNRKIDAHPQKILRMQEKYRETTNADTDIHIQRRQTGKGERKERKDWALRKLINICKCS